MVDGHTLDVRFFERGAGETMSSGTGSTGAGAAALARGLGREPGAGADTRRVRWSCAGKTTIFYLAGPAEIVAQGEFYLERTTD